MTLGDYADRWLRRVAATRKRRSAESYAAILSRHVLPPLGRTTPLAALTRGRLVAFLESKLAAGYAPETVRGFYRVLRAMLYEAVIVDELLATNPAARLGRLVPQRKGPRRHVALDTERLDAFHRVAEVLCPHLAPLFIVLSRTGLRLGEVLALEWGDVDLVAGRVTVARGIDWRRRPDTPKGNRARLVGLSPRALGAFAALRARAVQEAPPGAAARPGRAGAENPLGGAAARAAVVFANPRTGRAWSRVHLWRTMRRVCRAAGLPPASAHALRVSFATGLRARGVDLDVVRELLGHRDVATTRAYVDLPESDHRQAVALLDA